jgi:hypothetical protein
LPAAGDGISTVVLVGLDLDERIVLGDLLPFGDEPARDLAFGQALAEVRQLQLVRHQAILIASSREHGVHTLDAVDDLRHAQVRPRRCRGAIAYERSIPELALHHGRASVPIACSAARSRSSSKPNASHASAMCARRACAARGRRSRRSAAPRSTKHSIAVPDSSPSPCARVAVTGGHVRAVDADRQIERRARDELLAVDVAAAARGGPVEWMPSSSGGMPITPRNGASATRSRRGRRRAAVVAVERPHDARVASERLAERPGRTSSMRTTSVCRRGTAHVDRADQRVPASSCSSRGSNVSPAATRQPAFGHENATESPGSIVATRGRSREKWPCRRRALVRQLVDHARGAPIQASRRREQTAQADALRPRRTRAARRPATRRRRAPPRLGRHVARLQRRLASHTPIAFGSCSLSGSGTSASRLPGANASSCTASSRYDTPRA